MHPIPIRMIVLYCGVYAGVPDQLPQCADILGSGWLGYHRMAQTMWCDADLGRFG